MTLALTFALVAAINATAMQASTDFDFVDGWSIQKRTDGCFISAGYDPGGDQHQDFAVFLDTIGQGSVMIYDSTWTFDTGDRSDLSLEIDRLDDDAAWDDLLGTVVDDSDGGRVVLINFDQEATESILSQLSGAEAIELFAGGQSIANLGIEENTAGFSRLSDCLKEVG